MGDRNGGGDSYKDHDSNNSRSDNCSWHSYANACTTGANKSMASGAAAGAVGGFAATGNGAGAAAGAVAGAAGGAAAGCVSGVSEKYDTCRVNK